MTINQAKKVLYEHRPEKPRNAEQKQLQKAIDVILNIVDDYDAVVHIYDEKLKAEGKREQ
jgi:hypothetical protein